MAWKGAESEHSRMLLLGKGQNMNITVWKEAEHQHSRTAVLVQSQMKHGRESKGPRKAALERR